MKNSMKRHTYLFQGLDYCNGFPAYRKYCPHLLLEYLHFLEASLPEVSGINCRSAHCHISPNVINTQQNKASSLKMDKTTYGHLILPHLSSHSPGSHNPKADVPYVTLVARLVIRFRHKGGATVQEHVMNNVVVLNHWFNLRHVVQRV